MSHAGAKNGEKVLCFLLPLHIAHQNVKFIHISMAKKKHKKREKYDDEDLPAGRQEAFLERELRLHPDAKKSVLAVLLIAFAIILVLARFEKAGPAGDF